MKDLNEVLAALRTITVTHINTYLPESIPTLADANVVVEFPDIDRMPKSTMIYIQPNSESISPQTVCTNLSSFSITVYILCKRDTHTNLTNKVIAYYTAFCKAIMHNPTLAGAVDMTNLESCDYYPYISAEQGSAGAEVRLTVNRTIVM